MRTASLCSTRGVFTQVRGRGVLGSSQPRSNTYEQSGLRSADLEALRRQEESGLLGDAQLGQDRELIKVTPKAYDLAVPNLDKQRARHRHPAPARGMVSPVTVASRSVWVPL